MFAEGSKPVWILKCLTILNIVAQTVEKDLWRHTWYSFV